MTTKNTESKTEEHTMTENMKAFIEKAELNEALKVELEAINKEYTDMESVSQNIEEINKKTIDIAAGYGITLIADDFIAELPDEQLKNVAGGGNGFCGCAMGGYGGGLGANGEGWCTCAVAGVGRDGTRDNAGSWCLCPFVGGGGS